MRESEWLTRPYYCRLCSSCWLCYVLALTCLPSLQLHTLDSVTCQQWHSALGLLEVLSTGRLDVGSVLFISLLCRNLTDHCNMVMPNSVSLSDGVLVKI